MISHTTYDGISRQWRLLNESSHAYDIILNDSVFRAGFSTSSVFESDYRRIIEQKARLMHQYKGMLIDDVFNGYIIETDAGPCFEISTDSKNELIHPDPSLVRKRLLQDLTLLRGIGQVKAARLKNRGYRTITDLVHHRRFGEPARECGSVVSEGTPGEIINLVRDRHSPSHASSLLASALFKNEEYVFLDLETLGFFSRPIILFGLAFIRDGVTNVRQVLVREIDEELPSLLRTRELIRERPVVVSFNGKTFDMPYLVSRSAFYGEIMCSPPHHIDLLHAARRLFGHTLRDCRLGTIENHVLGNSRSSDLPGSMVPEFYETYHDSGNPGPLVPIIEHNLLDLVSLPALMNNFLGA